MLVQTAGDECEAPQKPWEKSHLHSASLGRLQSPSPMNALGDATRGVGDATTADARKSLRWVVRSTLELNSLPNGEEAESTTPTSETLM